VLKTPFYNVLHTVMTFCLMCSGIAQSGGCFNHVMSSVMSSAIALGYVDSILEEYRAALRVRVVLLTTFGNTDCYAVSE